MLQRYVNSRKVKGIIRGSPDCAACAPNRQERTQGERRRTDTTAHDDMADIAEDRPSLEDVIDARQRLSHLRAVVAELPQRTRQVFVLHRIEELTYGEVAARLGISESSVQKHLARALRHVMQRIKPS